MRFRLTVLALALALAPAALWAADFEDGAAAAQSGDYTAALRLWRPLAEQGLAQAQFNPGGMYRLGQGVPQDDAGAALWVRKAAEQGHAKAQLALGLMFETGQGVPLDRTEAYRWSRKAAEQGVAPAQYALGLTYGSGGDDVQAHVWFNLAALQGHKEAGMLQSWTADVMTPGQIAEAQKLAREWKPKR